MKKYIAVFLTLMLALMIVPTFAIEVETGVTVVLDGTEVVFPDQEPLIVDGRTMIPVRGFFETIGAAVEYTEEDQAVHLSFGETRIEMRAGNQVASVTEQGVTRQVTLDVPVMMVNDRTMAPLRFMVETMQYEVQWDEAAYTVYVSSKQEAEPTASPTPSPTAVPVASAGPDIINQSVQTQQQFSVYRERCAAVKADGSVWSWSNSTRSGSDLPSRVPEQVPGIQDAVAVTQGYGYTAVLLTDGSVWMSGSFKTATGTAGAGGYPISSVSAVKWNRIDGLSQIVQISGGDRFLSALDKNGTVWSLGKNDKGQLGNGETQDSMEKPVKAEGLPKVSKLAAGSGHIAVLTEDERIFTWGANGEGQLGRSPKAKYDATPRELTTLIKMVDVAAGPSQTVAARKDGSTYVWGTTYLGAPGDDEVNWKESDWNDVDEDGYFRFDKPEKVRLRYYDEDERGYYTRFLINTEALSCGEYQTLALRDGHLFAWGDTPMVKRSRNSQTERFFAQEYEALEVSAVYGGEDGQLWALDTQQNLWRIDSSGKTQVANLS